MTKRTKRAGVAGKRVAENLYVHRIYTHVLPENLLMAVAKAIPQTPFNFPFDIVKVNAKTLEVSLIHSPDFDRADEPEAGDSVRVSPDGKISAMRKGAGQIYHHKWTMVGDDYRGFDVARSKERSEVWENLPLPSARDKSRIGSTEFWNRHARWWINRMQEHALAAK